MTDIQILRRDLNVELMRLNMILAQFLQEGRLKVVPAYGGSGSGFTVTTCATYGCDYERNHELALNLSTLMLAIVDLIAIPAVGLETVAAEVAETLKNSAEFRRSVT